MKSLDPRVNRLPPLAAGALSRKAPLDQLGTFEVFVQPREGKPYQHEGAVHASDAEMAFVLAKETFTRRFTCSGLWVADTRNVWVSPLSEGTESIYDTYPQAPAENGSDNETWEIFHLMRRGKQHIHALKVNATSAEEAVADAKLKLVPGVVIYNIWAIRTSDIRITSEEEMDFWVTLPEKKFRDAAHYKGGDRLKDFIQQK